MAVLYNHCVLNCENQHGVLTDPEGVILDPETVEFLEALIKKHRGNTPKQLAVIQFQINLDREEAAEQALKKKGDTLRKLLKHIEDKEVS